MEAGNNKERKPRSSPHSAKPRKRSRSSEQSFDVNPSVKQRRKKTPETSWENNVSDDSFPGFVDQSEQHIRSNDRKRSPRRNDNGARCGGQRRGRNDDRSKRQRHSQHARVSQNVSAGEQEPAERPPIPTSLTNDLSACKQTLRWHSIHPRVPIQSEKTLLKTLICYKARERGMMRNAGDRYKEIAKRCQQVGMKLSQALSLRRQHMRHLNPRIPMPSLGLGKNEDIRKSAALFESSVEAYMSQCNVQFLTERQQKAALAQGIKTPPTPDFKLSKPTRLSTAVPLLHPANQEPYVCEFVIQWIEVKMFYGASIIAKGSASAVGQILSTAEKYVSLYGTGAMVFMYGCGKELAEWLLQIGVVALDAHPLDLRQVENHQRTWCANKSGLILP